MRVSQNDLAVEREQISRIASIRFSEQAKGSIDVNGLRDPSRLLSRINDRHPLRGNQALKIIGDSFFERGHGVTGRTGQMG